MSKENLDHIVSGVLFDFMGWLTSRDEPLTLSCRDDCGPAVSVISQFLTMRGVDQDCSPAIHLWTLRCSAASPENQPVSQDGDIDQDKLGAALNTVKQVMIGDGSGGGSYAHSWHCNIAMMCYDELCQTTKSRAV